MTGELITVDVSEGVAEIFLNRGDTHNSLNLEMFHAIADCGEALKHNADIRVAILSGKGPSFCSGLDLSLTKSLAEKGVEGKKIIEELLQHDDSIANLAQNVCYVWQTLPFPVVAAVHGVAFGGGFQIAMGCDIRIASRDAKFSIMESRWGLIPDMAITQTIPNVLRKDQALELALTARIFDSVEAERIGVVTSVAEDALGSARGLAGVIAMKSPDAVRACKRLFNEGWNCGPREGFKLEAQLQRTLLGSVNQREAALAGLEKRPAQFK
ncbi:MAG: crotonase/enoyl-CoA hydratase family protein [Rubritalea sp.]|uniref:crotonase/enoyl-CoA hydratase family protein n=1 Tax=Rubritalea sp. TaxID=2109375 RepID=UPI0032423191